jgi:chromosome partitioning protein
MERCPVDTVTYKDVWDLLEWQLRQEIKLVWPENIGPVVLAIDSEKGGVGKTGLVAGLAAVGAASGLKVCAIDLDPRATLTQELGATDGDRTVNDLLYVDPNLNPRDRPPLAGLAAQALRSAGDGWPSTVQVLAAERALANRETDPSTGLENRLAVSMEGVAELFDLVVIDLPPRAGGKLVGAGLLAATHVLYAGTLDSDGFDGVVNAQTTFAIMKETNRLKIKEVGVLRNIVDTQSRSTLTATFDQKFGEQFGSQLLPAAVPRRVIRQESRTACVPITAATGKAAREVINGYTATLNCVGRAA